MQDTNILENPLANGICARLPEPEVFALTADEAADAAALDDREYRLMRVLVPRLQADGAEFRRAVERRLGLPPGALGTTHSLDAGRGVVVPLPRG